MTAFFTKKQKIQMRERQRRKKGLLQNDKSSVKKDTSKPTPPTSTDNEQSRQQQHQQKQPSSSSVGQNKNPKQPAVNGSIEIVKAADIAVVEKKGNDAIKNSADQLSSSAIVIPSNLSTNQAKKFRKDARRQARAQGLDDSQLQFIVEGQDPPPSTSATTESKDDAPTTTTTATNNTTTSKKSKKRSFPCLKELVEQEREAKKRRLQVEQRQLDEQGLTDEYKSRYVALDCEMVGIGSNGRTSALARVSLVDWHGHTLLDTFVQVPTRVTDFRTHVSGVTPQHLKQPNAMDMVTCRDQVAVLLKNKILVGHALHNDLSALMLQHPKTDRRDTATYRPFQRIHHQRSGSVKWRPRKLRDLVKEHLQLDIQTEGQAHDSVQDAQAAMQLFQAVRSAWEQELEQQQQQLPLQQQQKQSKSKRRKNNNDNNDNNNKSK